MDHCARGSVVILFEGCNEDIMYLSFLFFLCIFSFPSFFRFIVLVHKVLWPFIDIRCTYFLFYNVDVCFSFTYHFMCCFFSPFIQCFLYLYAIYYFCFTQKCLDEFCLKCFRNTSCQSLLVINSLLAKFFKSLFYDRFYCI